MAGVFDIELHEENVEKDDSDDDAIEIEEVSSNFFFHSYINRTPIPGHIDVSDGRLHPFKWNQTDFGAGQTWNNCDSS